MSQPFWQRFPEERKPLTNPRPTDGCIPLGTVPAPEAMKTAIADEKCVSGLRWKEERM
jgi:hypothetical protein